MNLSDVADVEWRRNPNIDNYPLLPLQNTLASTSRCVLTNTSASVVAYRRPEEIASVYMQNAEYYDTVTVPTAPDGLSGDLFLSLDLQQAVRADVAVQFDNLQQQSLSVLLTSWVSNDISSMVDIISLLPICRDLILFNLYLRLTNGPSVTLPIVK